MKITLRRHPGTPKVIPTMTATTIIGDDSEDEGCWIDTESATEVEIEHNYLGVMFITNDGERLSVAHRDSGFELRYCAVGAFSDAIDVEMKAGHVTGVASGPPNEPWLGLATNRQLIEELATRWSMGSVHPDYSTMTGEQYGTDEYVTGEVTVAATPPVLLFGEDVDEDTATRIKAAFAPRHVYRPLHPTPNTAGVGTGPCQYPGCIAEPNSVTHGALDLGLTRADQPTEADPEHHDPRWEVPDEPWRPDQTKCYPCDGHGSVFVDQGKSTDVCRYCQGTGLADPPGEQLRTAVTQAIGSGSVCWEHIERAGVFHSEQALWIADGLMDWIHSNGWHHG